MADGGRVTIKAILDSSGISRGVKDIDRALGSIKTCLLYTSDAADD